MDVAIVAREKRMVALGSVVAALVITAGKLLIGIETNSLGILSEAAHSGLDLVAAVMTLVAVGIADKPADKDHTYGHGKVENLSAFLETLLLVITCGWIIYEAVERLLGRGAPVDASNWGFAVIIVSIGVDYFRSRALYRVARKHNSQALEADALHFASDIWSSLVVLLGLAMVKLGFVWVDAVAALIVAILVLAVSFRLGKRTIDALMDRIPADVYDQLAQIIVSVPDVEKVKNIRVRQSGAKTFIDTTISIRRTVSFLVAHRIMDEVEKSVGLLFPHSDVIVHSEPIETAVETWQDKVIMAVVGMGYLPPHNLEIVERKGKLYIDFDLEVSEHLTFQSAHEHTERIERELLGSIPNVADVTIHIEEYLEKRDSAPNFRLETAELQQRIEEVVLQDENVRGVSRLILLPVNGKYNLSLCCVMDKDKELPVIHRDTRSLASRLHVEFPLLRRVLIHAEPSE